MKYIVYLTVNKNNNKIYIGQHKTDNVNIFDGYIGNMVNIFNPSTIKNPKTKFQQAVKKHGFDSFRRYILAVYDTLEEALLLESLLVNNKFLEREDVYNMAEGGQKICTEKEVYQFNINGSLIKHYKSLVQAAEENQLVPQTISVAARQKKSYKNYFWSFDSSIDIRDYTYIGDKKPVYMFTTNMELIKVYPSTTEAALDIDVTRESIRDAIYQMTKVHNHYYSYNENFSKHFNIAGIIYQYGMDGNFIKEDTIGNFSTELGLESKKLFKAANSGLTMAKFQWNMNKVIKMENKVNYTNSGIKRRIGQYDLNGNLVKEYESVKECKKIFTNVQKVLSGKLPTTKGFIFKYI